VSITLSLFCRIIGWFGAFLLAIGLGFVLRINFRIAFGLPSSVATSRSLALHWNSITIQAAPFRWTDGLGVRYDASENRLTFFRSGKPHHSHERCHDLQSHRRHRICTDYTDLYISR